MNWVFITDIVVWAAFTVLSGVVGILLGSAYINNEGVLWLVTATSVICGCFLGYRLTFKK